MRKVTGALLVGAYLCLALTTALLLWRGGGGWGAGIAGLIGVMALAFSIQTLVVRGMEAGGVRRELEALREAQQILADQIEATATLETTAASGNAYRVTWESDLNVGEALAHFTSGAGTDFVAGEPIWISKPSWWPKCVE